MLQACRPAGRLFYWALVVVITASSIPVSAVEETSSESGRTTASSPTAKPIAPEASPRAASPTPQSGPPLTSVVDTVYLASGSPAQGILVITWPAFVTAAGTAVAPGVLNETLGANGALNVALASNAGANPPGAYYTVVYQLGPGEVRTEDWVVPTSSPATLAQVRTTPGSGTAAAPASVQYVNTAVAGKANDNAVVHLAGAETISGSKSFATSPNVPSPVGTGDVANKAYVDSSVATVGAGNYLPTAGGTMTGPITLSGSPTAPQQAASKQYVDLSAASKADLVNGLVPTVELGSGVASGLNCLLGSGTWGPCGSSANATAIQSVPVVATAPANGQVLTYSSASGQYAPVTPSGAAGGVVTGPSASQNITQPVGTQLSVNNLSGIRYVTAADNWTVSPSGSLIGGTQATVTLTPCPVGVDTSGNSMYFVYLSGQGTPEAAMVTGGTCTSGGASGTIVFTPKNTHSATYVLSSGSSGIQEAINDACGAPNGNGGNPETLVAPATVLHDDMIANAPAFCTYTLVNAANMQCSIAYTYAAHISLAEVRMSLDGTSYVTGLVGALSEGAQCEITTSSSLDFYPQYVPALNELIVASYRGNGRAVAQLENAASVASLRNGPDDGTRGTVRVARMPGARTDVDCENAALAILDDAVGTAWYGAYATWSDFLPGMAADIFPGDAIAMNVPSRGAVFTAVVREVEIQIADPADDRAFYTIRLANDLADPLGIEYAAAATSISLAEMPPLLQTTQVGSYYQMDLTAAQITGTTSTTVQVDAGMAPTGGGGIEVREHDFGWGQANGRNLLGRFSTQTFSLPRLARTQTYFLRLYDSSSPPRYSRYSAALHIDYPL